MKSLIGFLTLAALVAVPATRVKAQDVRVDGDGGFDAEVVRTLQAMTEIALRQHGVVDRHFVLAVGRIGSRIPLSLEEVASDGSTVHVSSLAASQIEEADVVIARLVEAVLGRKDASRTARYRTVVDVETAPMKKLPTERHWKLGSPVFPGGFYSSYSRETASFLVGVTLEATGKWGESGSGAGFFGAGAAWLASDGSFSPFIGAGAGMVWVDDQEGTGAHLEAGVEMLRLHSVRFILAADVIIPAFDPRKGNQFSDAKRVYPSLQLRVGF